MPGYNVRFDKEAEDDLLRFPPLLASQVLEWIERCAISPSEHALKPSFPHHLFPKFHSTFSVEGSVYYVVALFQYSSDETSIEIRALSQTKIGGE